MPNENFPEDRSATALFPQFETELYRMISAEVEGLTESQLDFESDRWEWSKWSIRRNLSHMASGDFRWFLIRWGRQLFPDGLEEVGDPDSLSSPKYDRRLDEEQYWDVEDIKGKIREGLAMCWSILSSETVGSLRSKELEVGSGGPWANYPQLYPSGLRTDPADPSLAYVTLEATFQHRYYEHITHLYNIQRLKRAQVLDTKVEIPFEGYWALPEWDRSEP